MLQHCGNQQAVMGLACRFPGARGLWGGGAPPLLTSMRDLPGRLLCAEHLRGHP